MTVYDHEPLTINLIGSTLSENGTVEFTVSRADTTHDLRVILATTDARQATTAAFVVIPAGSSVSDVIQLTGVNDDLVDGDHTI